MLVDSQKLLEIENEIITDKRKYFDNCQKNYSEYISVAQRLFPHIYLKMAEVDENDNPWVRHNSKALDLRKKKDFVKEKKLLERAVANNIYTPATYERLATIYSKAGDLNSAYKVCKKWFDSEFWMIPNMASGSLRLLERMEKLKSKLQIE